MELNQVLMHGATSTFEMSNSSSNSRIIMHVAPHEHTNAGAVNLTIVTEGLTYINSFSSDLVSASNFVLDDEEVPVIFSTQDEDSSNDSNAVDPCVVQRLRKRKYRKRVDHLDDELCSICHGKYRERVKIATTPCSHVFHDRCLTKWLKRCNTCPLCRQMI